MEKVKYVLYVDFMANKGKAAGLDFIPMIAKNLPEAIQEADSYSWKHKEEVYLLRIMEKSGKAEKTEYGKRERYIPVLCKRTKWRVNNPENCESMESVFRHITKNYDWFGLK